MHLYSICPFVFEYKVQKIVVSFLSILRTYQFNFKKNIPFETVFDRTDSFVSTTCAHWIIARSMSNTIKFNIILNENKIVEQQHTHAHTDKILCSSWYCTAMNMNFVYTLLTKGKQYSQIEDARTGLSNPDGQGAVVCGPLTDTIDTMWSRENYAKWPIGKRNTKSSEFPATRNISTWDLIVSAFEVNPNSCYLYKIYIIRTIFFRLN